jgi:hypothetical protein
MVEHIIAKGFTLSSPQVLDKDEEMWLEKLHFSYSYPNFNERNLTTRSSWQLQLTQEDFKTWKSNQASFFLFFDGASKRNPWVVIFLTPKDNNEVLVKFLTTLLKCTP